MLPFSYRAIISVDVVTNGAHSSVSIESFLMTLSEELRWHRAERIVVGDLGVEFHGGLLRPVSVRNILVPIDSGVVVISPSGAEVMFELRFLGTAVISALMAGLVASPVIREGGATGFVILVVMFSLQMFGHIERSVREFRRVLGRAVATASSRPLVSDRLRLPDARRQPPKRETTHG